jgi:O-antigen ligase
MAAEITAGRPSGPSFGWLRRRTDVGLSFALGLLVAGLILTLPMQAALASAVAGAFIILALVDTRVAVLALLLLRAWLDVSATVPLLSAAGASTVNANAMLSLLVIALGAAHIGINRVELRKIPLTTPFAAFVAITFLGIVVAPDKVRAAQDWMRIASTLILYIVVVDLMRSAADRRWVVRMILLSAIPALIGGVYQFLTDSGNHDTPGFNRITGTFVHPSVYAFYLVQLLPLALVFFLHTRNRIGRVGLFAMIPLMLFSIYATQTRGAWVGLIVMLAVLLWVRARWSVVLIPLLVGAMVFGVPSMRARVTSINSGECVSETNCQSSVLWRTKQWEAALNVPSPPELLTIGAGIGAVDVTLGQFTHNEYVRLLVETGALGLFATIVLYFRLFEITRDGYRNARTPYERDLMLAFLAALIGRVVIAASDNILVLVVLEWYFWAFAAIIVVLREEQRLADEHTREARLPSARAPARPALAPGQ